MTRLMAAALADPGLVRKNNEDRVWSEVYNPSEGDTLGLFIVCDGMGGYEGGECASHLSVETVRRELADYFCPKDPRATVKISGEKVDNVPSQGPLTQKTQSSRLEDNIEAAIQSANRVVYDYARQNPQEAGNAGTTITLAFVQGDNVVVANVGDSRTYLLREHKLTQISNDHSLVSSLVSSGKLKPEEVFSHPQRNIIYRSIGQKEQVKIDTFIKKLQGGDYLLLCSDGLWEMIQDEDVMVKIIEGAHNPVGACEKLVEAANTAGGGDNIGVVVVKVTS